MAAEVHLNHAVRAMRLAREELGGEIIPLVVIQEIEALAERLGQRAADENRPVVEKHVRTVHSDGRVTYERQGAVAYRGCVNPDCLAEEGDRHRPDCTPAEPSDDASSQTPANGTYPLLPEEGA